MFLTELKAFREKTDELVNNGYLRRFLDRYEGGTYAKRYYDILTAHTQGGKRLRPYFVSLGYRMAGKEPDDRIVLPALTFEVIQTGLLAQDDVFDMSEVRRGRPSVYQELGGDFNAMSRTVCLGDLSFFASCDMLCEAEFPDNTKLRAIQLRNKLFAQTMLGEMLDVEMSGGGKKATEEAILRMYRMKTAQYTVTGPLKMGMVLAGADEALLEQGTAIGDPLGIAFQIRDDILGIFGSEEVLGKSIYSDMREGKQTVLSAYFEAQATIEQLTQFRQAYGNPEAAEKELALVKHLFTETGALAHTESLCRDYSQQALKAAAGSDVDKKLKALLKEIIAYMTSRNK